VSMGVTSGVHLRPPADPASAAGPPTGALR
jgi:hypothetical protein